MQRVSKQRMLLGLNRHQALLIFATMLLPLLLNAVAMCCEVRRDWLLSALRTGTYDETFGSVQLARRPWPPVAKQALFILPIGILGWAVVLVSGTPFFQKLPNAIQALFRFVSGGLISFLNAAESDAFSIAWYWEFEPTGIHTGIHLSPIGHFGSWWAVLPLSYLLISWALQRGDRIQAVG